jgi:tRNA threonylcarbamoyladenosine biosynthesis protein TsaE
MVTRLENEDETVAFGRWLGAALINGGRVYIHGDLGAGKTTLCRGILRCFGYEGAVKSPTFTIVEPYELPDLSVYHFDLYRLADPNELEYLGIDDYFSVGNLCLVEWPERGIDALPECDLEVTLRVVGAGRSLELRALTPAFKRIADRLEATAESWRQTS